MRNLIGSLAFFVLALLLVHPFAYAIEFTARKSPSERNTRQTIQTPKKITSCTDQAKLKLRRYKGIIDAHYANQVEAMALESSGEMSERDISEMRKKNEIFYSFLNSEDFKDARMLYRICGLKMVLEPEKVPFWKPLKF